MPSFEFIDTKKPHEIDLGDHIIHQDRFWRVVGNYKILGYPHHTHRMLMLVPDHMTNLNNGFKFLEIDIETSMATYTRNE